MGFAEHFFKKGQTVEFVHKGTTHRGIVTKRKKVKGYPCAIVECFDDNTYTVPLALLQAIDIKPATLPKALSGLEFGPLRGHGTGREGPRWSRTWKFKGMNGTVIEDGDGGGLRWECKTAAGQFAVCDAINEAIRDEFGEIDLACLDAVVVEWATFDRMGGVTFREALDAYHDEVRALFSRP